MEKLELFAPSTIPLIQANDDLATIIFDALKQENLRLQDDDIIVIAQKIVSKAENRVVELTSIRPSKNAQKLAELTGRDPRVCQLVIDESEEIIETTGRMIIVRTKDGMETTQAGIDSSNNHSPGEEKVCLLPQNPDLSAQKIRAGLMNLAKVRLAVIMNDSLGTGSRQGSRGGAIGIAGIAAIEKREKVDLFQNPSRPWIALVDEISSAASIMMGQSDEGLPVVLVRGVHYTLDEQASIRDLLIPNWRENRVPFK